MISQVGWCQQEGVAPGYAFQKHTVSPSLSSSSLKIRIYNSIQEPSTIHARKTHKEEFVGPAKAMQTLPMVNLIKQKKS